MQLNNGFALVDVLRELHPYLFAMEIPAQVRVDLVVALCNIEHNLSVGVNQRVQLAAVVGAFAQARAGIVATM